MLDFVRA